MGSIMLLNGSPRAPKSNSKQFALLFSQYCKSTTHTFNISKNNHIELCNQMNGYSDLVLIFPLYVDSLPVCVLNFLKSLEANPPQHKPVISILINCGFLEYQQNDIAVSMLQFFCKQNGYTLGSVLRLGSGEAILRTPFRFIAKWNIRKFSQSIERQQYQSFQATMPLTTQLFSLAAKNYWSNYGKKFGITRKQMQTMQIE